MVVDQKPVLLRWLGVAAAAEAAAGTGEVQEVGVAASVGVAAPVPGAVVALLLLAASCECWRLAGAGLVKREPRNTANGSELSRWLRRVSWRT